VSCPNWCSVHLTQDKLQAHKEECGNVVVACSAAEFGCPYKYTRSQIEEHHQKCLFKQLQPAFNLLIRKEKQPQENELIKSLELKVTILTTYVETMYQTIETLQRRMEEEITLRKEIEKKEEEKVRNIPDFTRKTIMKYLSRDFTDFTGYNLCGLDLSNLNLCKVKLYRANLTNANLSNANLSNADLFEADLSYANLTNTQLPHKLWQVHFTGCDLSGCDLSGCDLSNCNLSNCKLTNT
jgi:hypothetical protein